MKKIVLTIICIFVFLTNYAQQMSLSSQYVYNDFLYNPAIAGVYDYLPLSLDVRRQWAGIKEAPVTQSLSAHGYVAMNLGCGGYIINEVTGPTRRTSANVSVAYHLHLSKGNKFSRTKNRILSFGLAALLSQHKYDISKLTTYEPDDIALQNSTLNYKVIPDAVVGIYLHDGTKYYAGLSIFNLVQSNRELYDPTSKFYNVFKRQYYLSGGYTFLMKNNFAFQPSFMAEFIEATPFQIDVQAKFIYQKRYWLALGYRLKDAITASIGYQQGIIRFGYSYEYALSALGHYTFGTHELNLCVYLKYKEKGKKKYSSVSPGFDF